MHDVTAALADTHRELAETSDGVTPYLPRFLDSYEDHSLMGIAAKKEASELLNKIQALVAMG